ncbi:hypothetical protein ACMFMG_000351 [Clarireedia jacksonii]
MPKVAKGRRKRAYRPKTKTGCLTCRTRRIKCDETRPACLKCTSASRTCDGYNYDNILPPSGNNPGTQITLVSNPTLNIHNTPQSHRSFNFFIQCTSPQLAGFFGSDFWERLVLQAAHHELAIRHAVVAVGSLHELVNDQVEVTDARKCFALEEYNLAIRELLVPLSRDGVRDVDVCLIACVLFTCFENMQGHHASAGAHIRSGVKLLHETARDHRNGGFKHKVLGSKSQTDSYASLEVLASVLGGLGSDASVMIGEERLKPNSTLLDITLDYIPLSFSSIQEAKDIFEYGCRLYTTSSIFYPSNAPSVLLSPSAGARDFEYLILKYMQAMNTFISTHGPFFTPQQHIAFSVLRMHILTVNISFYSEFLHPIIRSTYDKFTPQMEEILVLAEKVVVSDLSYNLNPSNQDGRETTSFCLDMGIIIPVFFVASNCQESSVRKKAIELLKVMRRQEGLWNSGLVAAAAERMEEIGKSGKVDVDENEDGRPSLELDAKGGRLRYRRAGESVAEEMWSW